MVRPRLPPRKKTSATCQDVTVLGDVVVPENVLDVLKRGPKFCIQPAIEPAQLLAYACNVSGEVNTRERERCLQDRVKAVAEYTSACSKRIKVRPVIFFLLLISREDSLLFHRECSVKRLERPSLRTLRAEVVFCQKKKNGCREVVG